ncbi:MAG TPA: GspE/PulE family protein, partial [Fimbriimonadaceae bacterium]|nr:GspE/PulE family protein [Fimbriimonadaceae bacterium]
MARSLGVSGTHMLTGEYFISEGLISPDQLQQAVSKQKELGGSDPIGRVLVTMGLVSERDRVRCLGKVWGVPYIDLGEVNSDPDILGLLSGQLAKRCKCFPIELQDSRLVVAMANPLDIFVIDELRLATGHEIEPMIAVEEDILSALNNHYKVDINVTDAIAGVMKDFTGEIELAAKDDEDLSEAELREMGEDAPIIRLANLIISQAITDKASDIHIEPQKDGLRVRYRVDGVLQDGMKLPRKVIAPLTSRMKIMSEMDIAEKRSPQDNRITAVIGGREYDFRVSTLPVVYGEKIVMRVLDKGGINVGLAKLGFLPQNLAAVEDMCSKNYGIILVTGPTGSGKSTTLYSVLNKLNTGERNIITIEDPVEYELAGINQCGVNVKAGMTFAAGLRAMLRQDPDVIMVGEMRDNETATIAMEAALTGHLVLSTLHTNDAPSAPTRLIDMDVEPFLISSSVIGVLAQRLVRQICTSCKQEYTAPKQELVRCGLPLPDGLPDELTLYRGKGCDKCKHSGYKGRTGVHELMLLNDGIRDEILEKSPSHVLRRLAID